MMPYPHWQALYARRAGAASIGDGRPSPHEQVLAQLPVESPFAVQARKQASRGVSAAPQSTHVVWDSPQLERHAPVLSWLAMQAS